MGASAAVPCRRLTAVSRSSDPVSARYPDVGAVPLSRALEVCAASGNRSFDAVYRLLVADAGRSSRLGCFFRRAEWRIPVSHDVLRPEPRPIGGL
jgi:hypothetical protein